MFVVCQLEGHSIHQILCMFDVVGDVLKQYLYHLQAEGWGEVVPNVHAMLNVRRKRRTRVDLFYTSTGFLASCVNIGKASIRRQ